MTRIASSFDEAPRAVATTRDVVRATGPDTEVFLQGQLSQDISRLAPGESAWSLLLQPQGKVDAWLRITRIDVETYLCDLDSGAGPAAVERLTRFKLRTRIELSLETWNIVSIRGPGSLALSISADSGAEVVAPADWPGIEGIDLLGPKVTLPEEVEEATEADLDHLRILAGVPAMGSELTERTIPAEAGIVERSVSFTKGCYTGQELVARIDSRGGNVPRRLRGVVAENGKALKTGSPVMVEGAEVGSVTSVSGSVGLAYIKRAVETLPAACDIDGTAAAIHELPLLRL